MYARFFRPVVLMLTLGLAAVLAGGGCSNDENSLVSPPSTGSVISSVYEKPLKIEVNAARHQALVLFDRTSPRGAALVLLDLSQKTVVSSRVLDYYDAFDVIFLPGGTEGCFIGKTQGDRALAVQFFRVADLRLDERVTTGDDLASCGYLTADSAGNAAYYSRAGSGSGDGVYKIRLDLRQIVDADSDSSAPFGVDDGMVPGLFDAPVGRVFFDASTNKLVVANLGGNSISLIDVTHWGQWRRNAGYSLTTDDFAKWATAGGGLATVHPEAMDGSNGVYVFAGTSGSLAFLSRYEPGATSAYPPETQTGVAWMFRSGDIRVHPLEPVMSVFLMQRDSVGEGIGQYSLNNLRPMASSPYRTQVIPDSCVCAMGLDVSANQLLIGDSRQARLELINIRQ